MLNLFLLCGVAIKSVLIINISHIVAFAFITILHIVFGELAPKSIAIQKICTHSDAISLPLRFFFVVFKPVIWLLNGFANFI